MKKIRTSEMKIAFLFTVLLMTIVGGAMAQVTSDSTTWEGSYEADVFPPVDNWVTVGAIATTGTIVNDPNNGNNYIHHEAPGDYEAVRSLDYVASSWTNGGASFEFRGRVLGGDSYDAVLGHISTTAVAGDTHVYWLTYYIHSGEIEIYNTNG